jgi:hypothetical protein
VSQRAIAVANIMSGGIGLGTCVLLSNALFKGFAPFSVSATYLYGASIVCGFLLGMTLDTVRAILCGIGLMALIAVLIFSGVLVLAAAINHTAFLDLILLTAFQQSVPPFLAISVLGCVGVLGGIELKVRLGQL